MHGNLVIVIKDKPGMLSDVLYMLSQSRTKIEQVSGVAHGSDAVLSICVSDPHRAQKVLEANGYSALLTDDKLVVSIPDDSAEKTKVLNLLATSKVKITDFSELAKVGPHSFFSISVDKLSRARKVLSERLITNFDPYSTGF